MNPDTVLPLRRSSRAARLTLFGLLCLVLITHASCTGTVINMTKPVMLKLLVNPAFDTFLQEEDIELAHQAIGGQLKLVEILVKNIQKDELRLVLCQGFTSYGMLMEPKLNKLKYDSQQAKDQAEKTQIETKIKRLETRIRAFGLRGRKHCFDILELRYPGFVKSAELGKKDYTNFLKKMSKRDVSVLFWAGFGWGYAILNGMTETTLIAQIPQLKQMMQRVIELEPSFFYGGGHLFLATLFSQSPTLGGDVKKAKMHFDAAYRFSNNKLLLVHYYQARFYAQVAGDAGEKMCKTLLKKIAGTSKRIHPKITMINVLAKELSRVASLDTDEFCP